MTDFPVSGQLLDAAGVIRDVQYAGMNVSLVGLTQLISPSAGLKIRVLGVFLRPALATTVQFMSGATGIGFPMALSAGETLALPPSQHGWFETGAGQSLQLSLTTAATTTGYLTYIYAS